MTRTTTPASPSAWIMPLVGALLLFVQPVLVAVVRIAVGEFRFDGIGVLSIAVAALGGWILTRDWKGDRRG
ncbi:hypothetical protein ACXR2T_10180 [Leucobacter sp. HY1910]